MVNNSAICIIGGYDELSKSLFKILRNKYKSTIFIFHYFRKSVQHRYGGYQNTINLMKKALC